MNSRQPSDQPLRVGVVGVGHLGKEHARVLASLPEVELVGIADVCPERLRVVAQRWGVPGFLDYRELIPLVEAITIAVPTSAHLSVARDFLARGIPAMVEKPLACNLTEADELVELARDHHTLLQVGHIECFNPAWQAAKPWLASPKFIRTQRISPYPHRSTDIGAVLDLMVHDLELIRQLTSAPLKEVQSLGLSLFGGHEDMASARLAFEDGCVAELSASRASLVTTRHMEIWSAAGYVAIDFAARRVVQVRPRCGTSHTAVTINHTGTTSVPTQAIDPLHPADDRYQRMHRLGLSAQTDHWPIPMEVHEIRTSCFEPLSAELREFAECCRTGQPPQVDGQRVREILALADVILTRIEQHQWDGHAAGRIGPSLRQGPPIPDPHWHRQPVHQETPQGVD